MQRKPVLRNFWTFPSLLSRFAEDSVLQSTTTFTLEIYDKCLNLISTKKRRKRVSQSRKAVFNYSHGKVKVHLKLRVMSLHLRQLRHQKRISFLERSQPNAHKYLHITNHDEGKRVPNMENAPWKQKKTTEKKTSKISNYEKKLKRRATLNSFSTPRLLHQMRAQWLRSSW